jgi:hypothetical protein
MPAASKVANVTQSPATDRLVRFESDMTDLVSVSASYPEDWYGHILVAICLDNTFASKEYASFVTRASSASGKSLLMTELKAFNQNLAGLCAAVTGNGSSSRIETLLSQ